jgi:hypothetical protein
MKEMRRMLVAACLVLLGSACVAESAVATPDPDSSGALASVLQPRYPGATQLVTNCPIENVLYQTSGALSRVCEFRAVVADTLNTGIAIATQAGAGWTFDNYFFAPPVALAPASCRANAVNGDARAHVRTISLDVHAYECPRGGTDLTLSDAWGAAPRKRLRIKHTFIAGGRGTNTIGLQNFIFNCVGKNLQRTNHHSRFFQATCTNIYGDGFTTKFEKEGFKPKPKPKPSSGGGASSCTPGYSPCIAPGSDVDCAGGGGDGPRYVQGPVTVTGSDPYGLDSDGNGIGCES